MKKKIFKNDIFVNYKDKTDISMNKHINQRFYLTQDSEIYII